MGYHQLERTIFCSSPCVRHFMLIFFRINIQLRESSLSKGYHHKFLKFAKCSPYVSDGHDYHQFMFLHDWKVSPPPPPPKSKKKDSDQSMILAAAPGNLSISNQKIFNGNIQHCLFCGYSYPGICIRFVFSSRSSNKK